MPSRPTRPRLEPEILGRIRGTLKREPLHNPLLALFNRDIIQRVYIPKGPPNPIPYEKDWLFACRHYRGLDIGIGFGAGVL